MHYSHPPKGWVVCASFIVIFAALQSSPKSVPTREFTTAQISDEVQEYVSWKSGVVVDSELHHTFSDTIETNRFADLIYVGKKNIRQLPERFVAVRFAYVIYPCTADKRVIFICRGMSFNDTIICDRISRYRIVMFSSFTV